MIRSRKQLNRCAAQPRLLSSNSGTTILLVVFLAGALLFALGTALVRRERRTEPAPLRVPQRAPLRAPESFERIDQLLSLGDAPSARELERLRDSAQSEEIRDAAEAALMVIASRL